MFAKNCCYAFLRSWDGTEKSIISNNRKKEDKMYLKELKIGNVKLKNNILLAPMAGITNLPFRLICEKFGVRFSIHGNGKQ